MFEGSGVFKAVLVLVLTRFLEWGCCEWEWDFVLFG